MRAGQVPRKPCSVVRGLADLSVAERFGSRPQRSHPQSRCSRSACWSESTSLELQKGTTDSSQVIPCSPCRVLPLLCHLHRSQYPLVSRKGFCGGLDRLALSEKSRKTAEPSLQLSRRLVLSSHCELRTAP